MDNFDTQFSFDIFCVKINKISLYKELQKSFYLHLKSFSRSRIHTDLVKNVWIWYAGASGFFFFRETGFEPESDISKFLDWIQTVCFCQATTPDLPCIPSLLVIRITRKITRFDTFCRLLLETPLQYIVSNYQTIYQLKNVLQ